MRCFFFVAAFMSSMASAIAEPPKPIPTTVADCMTILSGLEEIDAVHPMILNQGKPNEQVVPVPYEFSSVAVRRALAKDIRVLRVIREDHQKRSQKEMLAISSGKGEIRDTNKQPGEVWDREHAEYLRQKNEFTSKMTAMTSESCPIDGLDHIKSSDLKLEKNEIRGDPLASADKVIDWDK